MSNPNETAPRSTGLTEAEIDALYTQFDEDSNAYMAEHDWRADCEEDATKHALARAIERERERCAKIAGEIEDSMAQVVAARIRGEEE